MFQGLLSQLPQLYTRRAKVRPNAKRNSGPQQVSVHVENLEERLVLSSASVCHQPPQCTHHVSCTSSSSQSGTIDGDTWKLQSGVFTINGANIVLYVGDYAADSTKTSVAVGSTELVFLDKDINAASITSSTQSTFDSIYFDANASLERGAVIRAGGGFTNVYSTDTDMAVQGSSKTTSELNVVGGFNSVTIIVACNSNLSFTGQQYGCTLIECSAQTNNITTSEDGEAIIYADGITNIDAFGDNLVFVIDCSVKKVNLVAEDGAEVDLVFARQLATRISTVEVGSGDIDKYKF